MDYDIVIGLEIHIQLATKTKLFCGCDASFTTKMNKHCCPVCTGHLGALPILNEKAVDYAVKAGLALDCNINKFSMFDRKNYFYPDLPKGYQISQFYHPYAEHGHLDIEVDGAVKRIGITRIHIEEDAGKLVHNEMKNESYIDMNRCSIPLIEIVSDPDMSSSKEAHDYLSKVKTIIKYTGVSDVSMELGSLRCDANVSIKPKGQKELGTRAEIKNLNSFKAVAKAIDYEVERQKAAIESGEEIRCETRLWDEARMVTRTMRDKENAQDYRYFPDPDVPVIQLADATIERIRGELPELPAAKMERFIKEYSIPTYDASVLVTEKALADYFESVAKHSGNAKSSSNWIMTEVMRILKDKHIPIEKFVIASKHLGKLIALIGDGTISGKIAKELFVMMQEDPRDPMLIVEEKGMVQITDEGAIETAVDEVLAANPASIEEYNAGRTKVLGFLVGQVMQKTQGKANPSTVNKLMVAKITKE